MQTIEALTAAAVALLHEAPPGVVRRVLRELLNNDETPVSPSTGTAVVTRSHADALKPASNGSVVKTAKPAERAKGRGKAKRTPQRQRQRDPTWEQLRTEVRATMAERGLTYAALAAEIGMTEITTRLGICRTQPPGAAMMARLRAWLAAPAVASAATFPGRGAGNGSTSRTAGAGIG